MMAITDHLTGDARLVDWSVRFVLGTPGDLFLVHVEDAHTFARYMEVIRKLPELDTEVAHEAILKQLLKEPEDYIETVRAELTRGAAPVSVHPVVKLGHRVTEYTALIDQNQVDLLVFVSEDAHQVAMHGIAYSLAVELKHLPLLLL